MDADVRAVLDTSVVMATDVPPLAGELAISAATVAELHFSVLVAHEQAIRAERLRRLSIPQRTFDPLPVDAAVATSYGQLAAAVAASCPSASCPHDGPADRSHRPRALRPALHPQRQRPRRGRWTDGDRSHLTRIRE